MRYLLTVILLLFLSPDFAYARAGGGGVHFKNNKPYNCFITKKPSKPKWLTGIKKEKLNDNSITLTWEDADQAHDVEIRYNSKTKKTGDDSREKITKLKNGKVYSFKIRGVSNCGKSGWSKIYKATP